MASVSVVIPAYNPGTYLGLTIGSVLEQTFEDWEMVVIDDGSDEDLGYVARLDERVRLVRQRNAGLSAARNAAIRQSTGDYVAFIDADDLWLPKKLERQVGALSQSTAMLCSTGFDRIDEVGAVVGAGVEGSPRSYLDLLTGNRICVSSVMLRRAVLERVGYFDEEFAQVQDWDLWLRIARGFQLIHLGDVLTRYRHHNSNMSRNYARYLRESRTILARHATAPGHRAAIDVGLRKVKYGAAAQAYDSFRSTLNPVHLLFSLRHEPRMTLKQMALFLRRR